MPSSYCAIVTPLQNVRPHQNADRLKLANCLGNQLIVGLDQKDGDIGIFFPTDGQLSNTFVEANNLYTVSARKELGLPEGPTGFFDTRRRVRAQRFRGERSDGFWLPLSSLDFVGAAAKALKVGDTFTELGGYEICCKYYTPRQLKVMNQQANKPRKELRTFPKHDVTIQFRFVADSIPEDSIVYITEKLHGTSGRFGHVLDYETLPKWKQFLNTRLFKRSFFEQKPVWQHLNGSKNVVLERSDARNSWYGTDEFRYRATEKLTLHKGEVIYFEIVGFVGGEKSDTPIMQTQMVPKELPEIAKQYGTMMLYKYGCPVGESRIYVYKIAHLNEDGVATELSWPQLVQRCGELGVAHVPLLAGPLTQYELERHITELTGEVKFHVRLRRIVEGLTDGPSTLDPGHIREGVVVRTESRAGFTHLKNKAHVFGVMEGYLSVDDSFVDPEAAS